MRLSSCIGFMTACLVFIEWYGVSIADINLIISAGFLALMFLGFWAYAQRIEDNHDRRNRFSSC